MKRFVASVGLMILIACALVAAVWDGSAVAGVAGDFPGDGLYGACNSFPRDTSVVITNLENGKTVTVTITKNFDNPGVFIALSPKAAAELGMRAGAAARIRAVAITASQAEVSLPPARAGETADPDFNPKVYVERDKAAVKAAAAAVTPPAVTPAAVTPAVAGTATEPLPAVTVNPKATTQTATGTAKPAVKAPESAEVLAKVNEPRKENPPALPALTDPSPAAPKAAAAAVATTVAKPEPVPAAVQKAPVSKVPADTLPLPAATFAFPGSPKPAPLGMALPSPDLPSIPKAKTPTPRGGYLAMAPDVLGGSAIKPRKPAIPRVAMSDPSLPPSAKGKVVKIEKASVDALSRPPVSGSPMALALAEPRLAPDPLPEAILNRVMAPSRIAPVPVLAEAVPPRIAASNDGLETLALVRPSYTSQVEAAALADASAVSPSEVSSVLQPGKAGGKNVSAELAEAELPGSPEAVGGGRPTKSGAPSTTASLDEATLPGTPEAVGGAKPSGVAGSTVVATLDEATHPGSPEAVGGARPAGVAGATSVAALDEAGLPGAPDAIADRRPAGEGGSLSELQTPDVPRPSDSLAQERPLRPSVNGYFTELAEPGAIGPSTATTDTGPTAIADSRPGPGEPPSAELGDPEVPTPSESLTAGRPGAVEPGQVVAELAEPGTADSAVALASGKPALATSPSAELVSPDVPSPENLAVGRPSPIPAGDQTVALEPAAPRPPQAVTTTVVEPKSTTPAAVATVKGSSPAGAAQPPASIPLLKGLAKGSFYVQIGVYGTNDSLQSAIGGFKATYPLAVESLTTKAGKSAYRLFVGPLTRDESGAVLFRIRSLGYKDAYVRQGS